MIVEDRIKLQLGHLMVNLCVREAEIEELEQKLKEKEVDNGEQESGR